MRRIISLYLLCALFMVLITSCRNRSSSDIIIDENIGVEFDKLLGKSLDQIENNLNKQDLNLAKGDVTGAYTVQETVQGYPITVKLQFWNMNDMENPDWENTSSKDQQTLTFYIAEWDLPDEELTSTDYQYMENVYRYYEKTYGLPTNPEGFQWPQTTYYGNTTVQWKLGKNELMPELTVTFHIDKTTSAITVVHYDPASLEIIP